MLKNRLILARLADRGVGLRALDRLMDDEDLKPLIETRKLTVSLFHHHRGDERPWYICAVFDEHPELGWLVGLLEIATRWALIAAEEEEEETEDA